MAQIVDWTEIGALCLFFGALVAYLDFRNMKDVVDGQVEAKVIRLTFEFPKVWIRKETEVREFRHHLPYAFFAGMILGEAWFTNPALLQNMLCGAFGLVGYKLFFVVEEARPFNLSQRLGKFTARMRRQQ